MSWCLNPWCTSSISLEISTYIFICEICKQGFGPEFFLLRSLVTEIQNDVYIDVFGRRLIIRQIFFAISLEISNFKFQCDIFIIGFGPQVFCFHIWSVGYQNRVKRVRGVHYWKKTWKIFKIKILISNFLKKVKF